MAHKANFDSINDYISDFASTFLDSHDHNDPIDALWDEYKALCATCLAMIPQKKTVKQQTPWITNDIKKLSRKKQRKYNLAHRINRDENWRAYYNLKKEVQRLCRSSHNNYVLSLLDLHNKCTKKFWKYIKSMRKDQVSINTLQVDGKSYSDSSSKDDILNNYFSSVFTKDDQSPLPNIDSEPVPNISQITVEADGVYNLLTNLDPTKLQAQIVFPQNFSKKLHYTWLLYSLLFFKPHLTRENYHPTGNLPISRRYIKKVKEQILLTTDLSP